MQEDIVHADVCQRIHDVKLESLFKDLASKLHTEEPAAPHKYAYYATIHKTADIHILFNIYIGTFICYALIRCATNSFCNNRLTSSLNNQCRVLKTFTKPVCNQQLPPSATHCRHM